MARLADRSDGILFGVAARQLRHDALNAALGSITVIGEVSLKADDELLPVYAVFRYYDVLLFTVS